MPRGIAKENSLGAINPDEVALAEKQALAAFDRDGAEGPYAVQYGLQDMMQDLVGIVRQEQEMLQALERIEQLKLPARNGLAWAGIANTIPAGTRRSTLTTC